MEPQLSLDQIRDRLKQFNINNKDHDEDNNGDASSSVGQFDLKLDHKSGIATLCINNPVRKNAISGPMMVQFSDLLTQLESWKEVSSVIFYLIFSITIN